jgi:hypothetical protein
MGGFGCLYRFLCRSELGSECVVKGKLSESECAKEVDEKGWREGRK